VLALRYGSYRKSTKSFEAPPPYFERDERLPVTMVSAVLLDGRRIAVQVSDVSERGVGGRSAEPLPIGAELLLALPGFGSVPVEIRWALGARFGARFLKRMDVQGVLETMVALAAE
jgi:hypothetical protein